MTPQATEHILALAAIKTELGLMAWRLGQSVAECDKYLQLIQGISDRPAYNLPAKGESK